MKAFIFSLFLLILLGQEGKSQITATINPTTATCQANGTLSVTNVAGGKAPYKAALIAGPGVPLPVAYITPNVGSNDFEFTGLRGGEFMISLQDDDGDTKTFTITVQSTYVQMNFTPQPSLNDCSGNTYTGKVTVTGLTGGKPPYRYLIVSPTRIPASGFQSSDVFDNLLPGTTYEVQVWDDCENFQTRQVQIPSIGSINISGPSLEKIDCSGDYKAVFQASGGRGEITYKIVAPSFNQIGTSNTTGIFNLTPKQNYTIQTSDACGNVTTSNNTYINEIIPETQVWGGQASDCSDGAGYAYIWVRRGVPPYTGTLTGNCGGTPFSHTFNFVTTNEGYGERINNLPRPCSYSYTITDNCGTIITNTFEQKAVGSGNLGSYNGLRCPTVNNNGYEVVIGVGYGPPYAPVPNYTFDIKNSNNESVSGFPITQSSNEVKPSLAPGIYTYLLTDQCGTTTSNGRIEVPSYSEPTVSIDGTNKCINAGQVIVTGVSNNVVSGTRQYKIISGPNRVGESNTSGIFSNLISEGKYVFEFYDGCKAVTIPFELPPYQQPTFDVTFGAICAPATVSSIQAFNRTKSVEPYIYEIISENSTGGYSTPQQLDSTFSNLQAGQYNIRGSDACLNSFTFLGKVGNLTKPVLQIPTKYCVGQTIRLRATQCVYGATYTWYRGTTVVYTGPLHFINIRNATVADGGAYSIKVWVPGGCEFTSDEVLVVVSPQLTITNQSVCGGTTVNLTASSVTAGSEAGTLSYWTNSEATSSLSNPEAVSTAGTYYIKLVTDNQCSVVKPVVVAGSNFTPEATGNTVCVTERINLTSTAGSTYAWTGPLNYSSTLQNPTIQNASVTNSGVYTVVVTDDNGCAGTATAQVTVNNLPAAGDDQSICSPATTVLLKAITDGQNWTIITKPSGANPSVSVDGNVTGLTENGMYTFRLSAGTCFDDVQILRKVQPNAGSDLTTCATTASVNVASDSETWAAVSNPANPSAATIDAFGDIAGMTNPGVYQFVLTSENGCSDIVAVTKTIGVDVSTQDVSVCTAGTLQLTATSTTAGATYVWRGPAGYTSDQQNPTIANASKSNEGVYTVTAVSGSCSATATANVKFNQITVSIIAGITNACVGQNLRVRDAAVRSSSEPQVSSYFWSGPNGTNTYTSNTSEIIIPTTADQSQAGEYKLVETYDNGCVVTNTLTLSVTKCQSLGDLVWKDINNDGLNNNGELGIANVPVKLYNAANPTTSIATATTDSDGKYLFRDLIPGLYIVEIDAPAGYKSSTGTNGSSTGPFEPGINPTDDTFVDYNNQDHGTSNTGQLIRSGTIELTNFGEPIDDGSTTKADSVYNSSSNRTVDFGLFQPAQIGNFVWSDTNKNGIQDSGELGVSGVVVNLYAGTSTTPIATFTTGSDGKYLFDNLIAGTYTVEFVKTSIGAGNTFSPKNSTTSTPENDSDADVSTGKSDPITLIAGDINLTIDAGIIGDCQTSSVTDIAVPATLCVGQSLTINAISSDPLATYAWSTNAATAFTATTKEITLSNLTVNNTGVYTVLITNSNLCTSALTANVVVNPIPTIIVSSAAFCEGTTGTLTASGATSYSWSSPNGFTATTENATISEAATYSVVGNTNGCTAIATTSATIYPKTVLTATGAAICLGGNGTISVLPAELKYVWTGPTSFSSTLQTPSIIGAKDSDKGTYTVVVTDNNNCTASATVAVTVGTALTVTPISNSPVCVGTRLELSVTGGTGATFLWTSPKGVTTNVQNPFTETSSLEDKGIWNVTVRNADGCEGSGSVTVDVKPALTGVTATATAPGCSGDNISLTSTPSEAKSYEWSGTPSFTSTVQNPTIQKPSADQYTFTVKVTNLDGCSALATASTAIYTAPSASASSNSPICSGGTINLNVSTSASQFTWTGPNGYTASSNTPSILNANVDNSGTYTVIVTNANSCTAIATTSVTVTPTLDGGKDLSICTPISTAQLLKPTGGQTWKYFANGSSLPAPTVDANGLVSNINEVGSYSFILTQGECTDTVKVEQILSPDAGKDIEICSSITTVKLAEAPKNTIWSSASTNPSGTVINATTGEVSGLSTVGEYKFILKNTAGCTDTVSVKTKANPVFDVVSVQSTCTTGTANPDAKLVVSSADATLTYDYWEGVTYEGTKTFATATTISTPVKDLANPTADKSFTVRVFNSNGCFTDKTVVLKPRICECKADVCIPYAVKRVK